MLLVRPGAAYAIPHRVKLLKSRKTARDRARSREINTKTPDALCGSVSRKIAQMTSPKRRQCPPTAEIDENGGRRRTPFGPPLPAPGQATQKSNKIGLVFGYFVKGGAFKGCHLDNSPRAGDGHARGLIARSSGAV